MQAALQKLKETEAGSALTTAAAANESSSSSTSTSFLRASIGMVPLKVIKNRSQVSADSNPEVFIAAMRANNNNNSSSSLSNARTSPSQSQSYSSSQSPSGGTTTTMMMQVAPAGMLSVDPFSLWPSGISPPRKQNRVWGLENYDEIVGWNKPVSPEKQNEMKSASSSAIRSWTAEPLIKKAISTMNQQDQKQNHLNNSSQPSPLPPPPSLPRDAAVDPQPKTKTKTQHENEKQQQKVTTTTKHNKNDDEKEREKEKEKPIQNNKTVDEKKVKEQEKEKEKPVNVSKPTTPTTTSPSPSPRGVTTTTHNESKVTPTPTSKVEETTTKPATTPTKKLYDTTNNDRSNTNTTNAEKDVAFQKLILSLHNSFRSKHSAPPLEYDLDCEASAKKCADRCQQIGKMEHSFFDQNSTTDGQRHGQNIYWQSGRATVENAIAAWYSEVSKPGIDFNKPEPARQGTGHASQVLWKSTTKVGAAFSENGKFFVCNYFCAGNVRTKYLENLSPA